MRLTAKVRAPSLVDLTHAFARRQILVVGDLVADHDRGTSGALPARVRMELGRLVRAAAKDADAILVSDYGAGVLDQETRGTLRKLAQDGLTVCVDSRFALRAFRGFPVLKPNEPE